jgi:hypothetical protein
MLCCCCFCCCCYFLLQALSALAEVAPEQLSPYSPALAQLLLAEASGGRLWEGKEGLLTCLGGLGAACAATLSQQPGEEAGAGCGSLFSDAEEGLGTCLDVQTMLSLHAWSLVRVSTCRLRT